ncbi:MULTISPECIES: hypothetical protein [unclassified Streptomyces]|uniref:hypothetical protein n=1 Tax=unclassified Streptomyces TaxID=2593676 RepID=UPI003328563C
MDAQSPDAQRSTGSRRGALRFTTMLGTLAVVIATTVGMAPPGTTIAVAGGGGHSTERLWLLGGLALSLTAAGVIAVAATRGRRNQ